ncbi:MAG: LysE family transporter [Deltaproteobacteria bacterium]|nr:LysE family transporter [Deltaproteobacteria bacterium]
MKFLGHFFLFIPGGPDRRPVPGTLLTYTIIKSAKTRRRGYLMGVWIITGHALLEMVIIILLIFGFSFVLKNVYVVRIIGVVGGLILIFFGAGIVRNVYQGKIRTDFLNPSDPNGPSSDVRRGNWLENPFVGGILISMANPYWWVWWATIGFAFMIQFNLSLQNWHGLLAFFLGHEAGDLIWYVVVSTLSFFGIRKLNQKLYYLILACCGLFMIFFGIYLGLSPLWEKPTG